MTWQSEREEWNKQGICAHELCKTDFGGHRNFHPHNGLYYCGRCSSFIRAMNGMAAVKEVLIDGVWKVADDVAR